MKKQALLLLIVGLVSVTGCAGYDLGKQGQSAPTGSYQGNTLNSPVTDQHYEQKEDSRLNN
ncbi:MAG: hypothetical protein LV481_15000 [Methylacidiphilales bacterium]|nr:hypothetical protein [Candidatus Methylacidiphilales bacterium]